MCSDHCLKKMVFLAAWIVVFCSVIFASILLWKSLPAIKTLGLSFFYQTTWNPVEKTFGALSFLFGTFLTSFLALFIAAPFALAIALFLGEYVTEGFFHHFFKVLIDLLAGIPSVIYGFWGLFFIVPLVRKFQVFLQVIPYGVGLFSASLVLALMIVPFCAFLSREVISLVPHEYKEVAISLGATRFEMIRTVILPYSFPGLWTGCMLAFGRALGETMAVTLVIGNSNIFPSSLFSPGNTIASIIANEFAEVSDPLYLSVLIELALVLFVLTAIINLIGKKLINHFCMRTNS